MIYKGINFNGTHYTAYGEDSFQAWCNWDDTSDMLYIGERLLVLVKVWANAKPIVRVISYINGIILKVIYNCDANGYFILDVTDIMRTFTKNDEVYVSIRRDEDPDTEGTINILEHYNTDKIFLRNPHTFPIPPSPSDVLCIMPPSRMLATDVRDGNSLIQSGKGFLWGKNGQNSVQYKYREKGETEWSNIADGEEFWIGTAMYPEGVEIDDGVNVFTLEPAPTECGVRYAMINWRSLVGPYKMHNFVVKSQKTDAQDNYSLLMVDNSYNTIKGSEESLILSIDELNTYDLWYYSDILTSSDVNLIAIDGEMLTGYGIRLEIMTKSVTIPSGDRADGKFEFEAKIKRYDAVTL